MSILAQATAGDVATLIVLSLLALGSFLVSWRVGLFRRTAVLGPQRVTNEQQGGWPLLVTLIVGTSAWLGTQLSLATYKQAVWTHAGHPGRFDMTNLTAGDYAFLSTVPGLVAVLAIAICLKFFAPAQRPRLGLTRKSFPAGVALGVAAEFLILPVILWVSIITELVYKAIQFKHPAAHELLQAMQETGPVTRWLLIIGAVLVAPVIEELLFRGLFQTLLTWAFNNAARRRFRATDAPPPPPPPTPDRLALGRWLAILITSVIFAAIHDKWSIPPIFVLAICLGFAYERTGNLWVTMSIHALFNGFQTLFYLLLVAK